MHKVSMTGNFFQKQDFTKTIFFIYVTGMKPEDISRKKI